ncbi:MAG: hypothetical protein Q4G46_14580, partial [Propionibacteriaceae bacterium]|nr:hypothetical protein [Propionibacteriaceae bacterium]
MEVSPRRAAGPATPSQDTWWDDAEAASPAPTGRRFAELTSADASDRADTDLPGARSLGFADDDPATTDDDPHEAWTALDGYPHHAWDSRDEDDLRDDWADQNWDTPDLRPARGLGFAPDPADPEDARPARALGFLLADDLDADDDLDRGAEPDFDEDPWAEGAHSADSLTNDESTVESRPARGLGFAPDPNPDETDAAPGRGLGF